MKRSRFTEEQIIGILREPAAIRRWFGFRRLLILIWHRQHLSKGVSGAEA